MKKMFTKELKYNPVIILGGGVHGLGIVRSFQKTKIPVYVFSIDQDFIRFSRFCKIVKCPDPKTEEFISFLKNFCSVFDRKPVIFATSDLFLMTLVRNKVVLEEVAYVPTCNSELIDKLIEKRYLYDLAEKVGISYPKTKILPAEEISMSITKEMTFPLIIKPSVNITFEKFFGDKALFANNSEDLSHFINDVRMFNYVGPIVIQEYIPGDMTKLYTITSYVDQTHQIRGYSIGHKIRQYPAKTGTITSGLVEHVESILEMSKRFLFEVGFYGISNIEYKYDERDGLYKLMEINPRTGLWNLSVLESGINLPLMAYHDILGEKILDASNPEGRLIWAYTLYDMLISLHGYKRNGESEETLSFMQWRKSLTGCRRVDAIFKWNDPLPAIANTISLLTDVLKKMATKRHRR